jgi:rhodanese-related sulfurtransferase
MFGRLFGSNNSQERVSTEVTVIKARQLQQQGAQLIDVRETAEFASGHAVGAYNIPLGKLAGRLSEIRRDGTVLLICQSGSRSRTAQGLLARQNVSDVRDVKGGTSAWRAAKLPME